MCAWVFDTGNARGARENERAVVGCFPKLRVDCEATAFLGYPIAVSTGHIILQQVDNEPTSVRSRVTTPASKTRCARAVHRSTVTVCRFWPRAAPSLGVANHLPPRATAS